MSHFGTYNSNTFHSLFNHDVVTAETHFVLKAQCEEQARRLHEQANFIEALTEQNQRLQLKIASDAGSVMAANSKRMLRQTEISFELVERLREVAKLVEGIAWRKRRVDSEKECVACGVLQSAFSGKHGPSCWIGALADATKVDPKADRAYKALRIRELGPQGT